LSENPEVQHLQEKVTRMTENPVTIVTQSTPMRKLLKAANGGREDAPLYRRDGRPTLLAEDLVNLGLMDEPDEIHVPLDYHVDDDAF